MVGERILSPQGQQRHRTLHTPTSPQHHAGGLAQQSGMAKKQETHALGRRKSIDSYWYVCAVWNTNEYTKMALQLIREFARMQDARSIRDGELHFYTLATSDLNMKFRKQLHL